MTLEEIKNLLVTVDPDIKHYFTMGTGDAYTYWEETKRLPSMANGVHSEVGWRFYVHRFAKAQGDTMAASIFQALDDDVRVAVSWTVDYEPETGYIHHIFECEGW